MFTRKSNCGIRSVDKIIDDIYRILNLIEVGSTASSARFYNGIPIYASHDLAPVPAAERVTMYLLTDDYEFLWYRWPDGSRHNVRVAFDWEEIT